MDDEFGGVYERIELPLLIDDGSFFLEVFGVEWSTVNKLQMGF